MHIRLLSLADLDVAAAHLGRHLAENGTPGDPLFAPFDDKAPFDVESFRTTRRERWAQPIEGTNHFERMWGGFMATDDGDRLVAHIDLHRKGIASEAHRVWLGMGIERCARGRGHGGRMLSLALDWVRAQPNIDWVDLGVFEENAPARALYAKAGFVETGRVEDRFRVAQRSVTDVQMALYVGPPA